MSSSSSKIPVTNADGCSIRFLPNSPLVLAKPSGKNLDLELSNNRGVPIPLHPTTTTRARCSCTTPLES